MDSTSRIGQVNAPLNYLVRSDERRESVAKLLVPEAEIHVCDVENEAQIARLARDIGAAHRKLAGLVHSIAFADYGTDGLLLGIELLAPCPVEILERISEKEAEPIRQFLRRGVRKEMISA